MRLQGRLVSAKPGQYVLEPPFCDLEQRRTRLSEALKEVIDARVWGGIHFRTADVQGTALGKKVAHWLGKHYFRPLA